MLTGRSYACASAASSGRGDDGARAEEDGGGLSSQTKLEFGAVPLTLGILGVLFLVYAASVGGIGWWLVAGGLICAALAACAVWASRRGDADEADAPAPRPHGDGAAHRVLVIADEACGPELRTLIRARADGATEARVLAPVLGSRLAVWTGDEGAYRDATARLEATLAELEAAGIPAEGRLAAADPLRAADDGLREFSADEIVFSLSANDGARLVERDLVERAERRYGIPVCALDRG